MLQMINSRHTQNIHHCDNKTNGRGDQGGGAPLVGFVYSTHVQPQKSKRDIRQGKLLPISVYLNLALRKVMNNGY